MKSVKCNKCGKFFSIKTKECLFCGAPNILLESGKTKKWYQRTSVSLSIAAIAVVIAFGFIHIVTGIRTRLGLPFDIAIKKSFGYKETFVNARKITSIPYVTAKIKYPLGCEVLQRLRYIDSGEVFDTAMKDMLLLKFKTWQKEFEKSISGTEKDWHDSLLGDVEDNGGSSRDAASYNNRGVTAAKNSEYETAITEFSRAINRNSAFVYAYYNRGLVYDALGHFENAISDFTRVIEILPRFAEGYASRGQIYLDKGQYEQAISDFSSAIEINPEHDEAYFNRMLANFALGEYDKTWDDNHKIEILGNQIPSEFMDILRNISNRTR